MAWPFDQENQDMWDAPSYGNTGDMTDHDVLRAHFGGAADNPIFMSMLAQNPEKATQMLAAAGIAPPSQNLKGDAPLPFAPSQNPLDQPGQAAIQGQFGAPGQAKDQARVAQAMTPEEAKLIGAAQAGAPGGVYDPTVPQPAPKPPTPTLVPPTSTVPIQYIKPPTAAAPAPAVGGASAAPVPMPAPVNSAGGYLEGPSGTTPGKDAQAEKKAGIGEGLTKTLQALHAVQPPAPQHVSSPAAPHPTQHISLPTLEALLQMVKGQLPSVAQRKGLGELLGTKV